MTFNNFGSFRNMIGSDKIFYHNFKNNGSVLDFFQMTASGFVISD